MSDGKQSQTRALVRQGLNKSLASLAIKVATAGLTFVMFVVLSRAMDTNAYGHFAFGLALATILAIGATAGQQTAILRYWPEALVNGTPQKAMQALKAGWALTLIAGTLLSLGLIGAVLVWGTFIAPNTTMLPLLAAALLVLPLGAAEYASSALRAQGSVWTALAPRDLVWRLMVPAAVWGLFLLGVRLDGAKALALTAGLLIVALALQIAAAPKRGYHNAVSFGAVPPYWREHGRASRAFFAGTVIDSAALNIDIVLVGLLRTAASAGVYFNAFRTAGLLTLFMFAINQVVAPIIARSFHAGEIRQTQLVVSLSAWAGFVFSLGVFALFVLFGSQIMSLFGPGYVAGVPVLLILGAGLLADAATGPTRIVMMMTGQQHTYVRIIATTGLLALVAALAVIPFFGIAGAAIVNATARTLTQALFVWRTRQLVGIDPSIFGLFFSGTKGTLNEPA